MKKEMSKFEKEYREWYRLKRLKIPKTQMPSGFKRRVIINKSLYFSPEDYDGVEFFFDDIFGSSSELYYDGDFNNDRIIRIYKEDIDGHRMISKLIIKNHRNLITPLEDNAKYKIIYDTNASVAENIRTIMNGGYNDKEFFINNFPAIEKMFSVDILKEVFGINYYAIRIDYNLRMKHKIHKLLTKKSHLSKKHSSKK